MREAEVETRTHRADDENGSEADGDGEDDGSDEVDHDDELLRESETGEVSFAPHHRLESYSPAWRSRRFRRGCERARAP